MPLYEFDCETCGTLETRICSYEEKRRQVCDCGSILRGHLGSLHPIGATPTKPERRSGQIFESESQVRRWEAENPGLHTISKSDSKYRDERYQRRHEIESRAQARGYRSEKHRQTEVKKKARSEGVTIG